jgi:hypothetical protein
MDTIKKFVYFDDYNINMIGGSDSSDEDESNGFDIIIIIKETFKNVYEWLKSGIMTWILIPILFGSVAPAIPFLIFMAVMFGVLKYLMGHLRNF